MAKDLSLSNLEMKIGKVIDAKTNDFFKLAEIVDLDPLTDFSGADLRNTDLRNAYFSHADLQNTNFQGACLEQANLSQANLKGVDFSNADLEGADFSNANLDGANFSNANLKKTNFENASLRNVNLNGAIVDQGSLIDTLTKPNTQEVKVFRLDRLFNDLSGRDEQTNFAII